MQRRKNIVHISTHQTAHPLEQRCHIIRPILDQSSSSRFKEQYFQNDNFDNFSRAGGFDPFPPLFHPSSTLRAFRHPVESQHAYTYAIPFHRREYAG